MGVFWKHLGQFGTNKSMNDGLFRFSKQVGSLLRSLTVEKSFKQLSFNSELRSPKISKLS